MNRCLQISARVDTRPRIFPTVRTIKRILADARRFPVLWPKVGLKRAKVFYSYTYERTARVHLATIMDVLKTSLASQRNSKKEMKKSKKPLMEKMRRARINDSLNELKCLVLEAMRKDASRYSKMEKADILEMTVKYLRSLNTERPPFLMQQQDEAAMAKYRAGFNECATKVSQFLITTDSISVPVRTQLLSHLASSCQNPKEHHHQPPSEVLLTRQPQNHTPLSSFPAISPAAGAANVALTENNLCATSKFPSPPSSPLHNQERKLLPFPPTMPSSMPPFVLSNGIPALILSNDAVQLVPFTLPNTSTTFDSSVWRPW